MYDRFDALLAISLDVKIRSDLESFRLAEITDLRFAGSRCCWFASMECLMIRRLTAAVAMSVGTFLSVVLAPDCAFAERRVALVVGNSSYQAVPQLPNPASDASAVAKMFRDAGFDTVDTLINVGNLEFKRAIRKFEATADQADIAVRLLRRPWSRNRRHELSHSGRRAIGFRPRRR